jgi:hypothetical protein
VTAERIEAGADQMVAFVVRVDEVAGIERNCHAAEVDGGSKAFVGPASGALLRFSGINCDQCT